MLVSASKNDRQSNIDSVNNAVKAWQGSGPNNQNFANVRPGPACAGRRPAVAHPSARLS